MTTCRSDRHAALVAEVRRNPNRAHRRWMVAGFDHVLRHGDLTPMVVAAGRGRVVAVVRGEDDRLGLSSGSRTALASAGIRVVDVAGAGHFVPTQQPRAVNEVVLDVLRRVRRAEAVEKSRRRVESGAARSAQGRRTDEPLPAGTSHPMRA